MDNKPKTHYRKVHKSDHLGVADLEEYLEEGRSLCFTIKEVKQQLGVSVAGRKGDHNIAYFVENIKPLVLNSTNAKRVKSFCNHSPFVEDWKNVYIELYIDANVRMKGDVVGGVRIKTRQPSKQEKPKVGLSPKRFAAALAALKSGKTTQKYIETNHTLTEEQKELLKDAVKN